MSDWVNWNELVDLMAPELERQAQERAQVSQEDRARIDKALSGLGDQAGAQAADGSYGGVAALGGYQDLLKAQQEHDSRNSAAGMKAPWEDALTPHRAEEASPWTELSGRLGSLDQKYTEQNLRTQNRQADEARAREQAAWNKAQREKLYNATQKPRDDEAAQYRAWSDYVQRQGQATGGTGGVAYLDAMQGRGPQPVRVPQTARTRETQQTVYGAADRSLWPEDKGRSGFGKGWI